MSYTASAKLGITRLVERSHLPVRRTLQQIGIARATSYGLYDLYRTGGPETLEERPSRFARVWNRIPDDTRDRILCLALDEPELLPRELAVRYTDTESYLEGRLGRVKPDKPKQPVPPRVREPGRSPLTVIL